MDKIKFVTDEGETVEFYVEEQTRVNGTDYLLVTDSMDDEANAYIESTLLMRQTGSGLCDGGR